MQFGCDEICTRTLDGASNSFSPMHHVFCFLIGAGLFDPNFGTLAPPGLRAYFVKVKYPQFVILLFIYP